MVRCAGPAGMLCAGFVVNTCSSSGMPTPVSGYDAAMFAADILLTLRRLTMKTRDSLKIENLESELFIEDLGRVSGGGHCFTTMAVGEEDSSNSCTAPHGFFDHAGFKEQLKGLLEQNGIPRPDQTITTLALGEE